MRSFGSLQKHVFNIICLAALVGSASQGGPGSTVFNVLDYGAKGNGKTNDAEAIQKAIDICTKTGGRVLLPAGKTYYSGAIYLKPNIDFHLEKGAVLLGSSNEEDYGPCADALINAVDAPNVSVTGCVIVSRSSALKIDEVWDDCRNIVFDSCVIYASNRGICIQSRDRGNIHDIIFSNIVINTQLYSAWWWGKAEPICITHMPRDSETKLGKVSNITFSNIMCDSENSVYIHGWKDNPVEDIVLDNVTVTIDKKTDWAGGWYDPRPGTVFKTSGPKPTSLEEELNWRKGLFKHKTVGIYCENASSVTLRDVQVKWGKNRPEYFGAALETLNVQGLALDNFTGTAAHEALPDKIIR